MIRKRSPQVAGKLGPDPKMIPKRSPELSLVISKGSPSVNPPSTIRFIQRAANRDPLSVSCPFGVGMGFPRGLQIRRFSLHGGSKQNRAQAGNFLAVTKRIGRKHPQHETPICTHLNFWEKSKSIPHPSSPSKRQTFPKPHGARIGLVARTMDKGAKLDFG